MKRRILLTGLILAGAGAATAAFAQGKKGGGGLNANTGGAVGLLRVDGSYAAYGRNPDGSEYQGRCDVVQQGTSVEFAWTIGDGTNRGSGVIEGRVITVDWGDTTPVVYVVMENGALHGIWADGLALEKLTPR